MEDIKRILVVSRDTKHCKKAVHYGVSLAMKYGAKLYVLHVADDPTKLEGYQEDEEHKKNVRKIRDELAATIAAENNKGLKVKELLSDGDPSTEIFRVVKDKNIDLIILLAHQESHIEHFLLGHSNDEIIREMPCSILMVKKDPDPAKITELKS